MLLGNGVSGAAADGRQLLTGVGKLSHPRFPVSDFFTARLVAFTQVIGVGAEQPIESVASAFYRLSAGDTEARRNALHVHVRLFRPPDWG